MQVLLSLRLLSLLFFVVSEFNPRVLPFELKRQQYSLDMEKLNLLYLQTSIIVLLKAKAKKELSRLPQVESILFDQCAAEARSTLQLASCVHRLIKERQRQKIFEQELQQRTKTAFQPNDLPLDTKASTFENMSSNNSTENPIILVIENATGRQSADASTNLASDFYAKPLKIPSFTILAAPASNTTSTERIPASKQSPTTKPKARDLSSKTIVNLLPTGATEASTALTSPLFTSPFQVFFAEPPTISESAQFNTRLHISAIKNNAFAYRRWMLAKLDQRYRQKSTKRLNFSDTRPLKVHKSNRKRAIPEPTTPRKCTKVLQNVENLRRIQQYLQTVDDCLHYLRQIGQTNARFLATKLKIPVTYIDEDIKNLASATHLEQFMRQLETKDLSFLSPRIMNLLPMHNSSSKQMYSPTILSFQDEGFVSLPRILSLISSNECELLEWIDLLVHMTGVSHRLQDLIDKYDSDLRLFRDQIQPRVQKLRELRANWVQINRTLTPEQRTNMDKYGYVTMTSEQVKMTYKKRREEKDEFLDMLKEDEDEQFLHQFIEELTQQSTDDSAGKRRQKRNTKLLMPSVFVDDISKDIIINNNILSSEAFHMEFLNPHIIGTNLVEARAFVTSILAPRILIAQILYPSAFRLMLLSPNILKTYVLVPEALVASVLSPKIITSKILSPDALTVLVLSPSTGTTEILSPHLLSYRVLSPSILTANFLSQKILTLEILSPSFLSISDES